MYRKMGRQVASGENSENAPDPEDIDLSSSLAGGDEDPEDESYLYEPPAPTPLAQVTRALTATTTRADTGRQRNYRMRNLPQTRDYESEIGRVYFNLLPIMRKRGLVAKAGPKRTLGLPSPSALMHQCGIEKVMCWQLVRYPKTLHRMDFKTLAKLCWGLGVTPGSLLIYVPPGETPKVSPLEQRYLVGPLDNLEDE